MQWLANIARWDILLLIALFGVVVIWKLFRSASFAGLLRSSDGTMSPGRIQLLVLTVLTALQYLLTAIRNPARLPAVPMSLVIALGGSQTVYLGAKAWSIFAFKSNIREEK